MSLGRAQCVTHRGELAQQQLGCGGQVCSGSCTSWELFSTGFHCTEPREQGLAQGGAQKYLLRPGEWGSRQARHRAIRKLHVLHWHSKNRQILNLFFFIATMSETKRQKINHICLQSRVTLNCI